MRCHRLCKQLVLLVFSAAFMFCSSGLFAQSDDGDGGEDVTVFSGFKICPFAEGSLLHSPYTFGAHLGIDFLFTGVLDPFYFGIGARGDLGLPQEDFPYDYEFNGQVLDSPNLVGGTFYVPFGVYFCPFNNENIEMIIEARGGAGLMKLVSFGTTAASKMHIVPYAGLSIGLVLYGVELSLFTEYDPVNQFTQGFKVAYRFKLKFGGKSYE